MKTRITYIVFTFFLAILLFTSCEDNPTNKGDVSTVEVRFRALYDGLPLIMNERYTYNGKDLSITNLRFYLSDLVLVKGSLEASIDEIELVDFSSTNVNQIAADAGILVSNAGIPLDTYDGIKFGVGVPSDLNAQTPSDFAPNHPLRNESDYWSTWDSYIFHKIEGRYDDDGDPNDLEASFVYHIGLDENFRERTFSNLNLVVEKDQVTEIVIDVELLDLLKDNDGNAFDLTAVGNIHNNPQDGVIPATIANNWANAFTL